MKLVVALARVENLDPAMRLQADGRGDSRIVATEERGSYLAVGRALERGIAGVVVVVR